MNLPLGWLQLRHRPVRLMVALSGIAFAVLLVMMQVGFRSALFESAVRFHERFDYDIGEYRVDYAIDTLDERYFPKTGLLANLKLVKSDQSLGADQEFDQAQLVAFNAWTADRHTFFAGIEYDVSSDDEIPLYALYSGGGFPRLSGYQYGELVGENFGLLMTGYRYQMLQNSIFPGYVGATLEYGNVSRDRTDVFSDGLLNGSVYIGIDSLIGPFYLGVGAGPGGRYTGFMTIGSIFINDSLIQ